MGNDLFVSFFKNILFLVPFHAHLGPNLYFVLFGEFLVSCFTLEENQINLFYINFSVERVLMSTH